VSAGKGDPGYGERFLQAWIVLQRRAHGIGNRQRRQLRQLRVDGLRVLANDDRVRDAYGHGCIAHWIEIGYGARAATKKTRQQQPPQQSAPGRRRWLDTQLVRVLDACLP
jgi:hypothetical protein